jgi:hypothetical protein
MIRGTGSCEMVELEDSGGEGWRGCLEVMMDMCSGFWQSK